MRAGRRWNDSGDGLLCEEPLPELIKEFRRGLYAAQRVLRKVQEQHGDSWDLTVAEQDCDALVGRTGEWLVRAAEDEDDEPEDEE